MDAEQAIFIFVFLSAMALVGSLVITKTKRGKRIRKRINDK